MKASFLGLLCLLFIGLKLGGVIAWSWWWVMAPLWAPAGTALILAGVALVLAVISGQTARLKFKR